MAKDYLKAVAAAYGSGDPKLYDIGQRALSEIEEARTELGAQAAMIRQFLNRIPKASRPPESKGTTQRVLPVVAQGNGGKLSDAMKDQIREYALGEFRLTGRWLTAQELVERMTNNGVNLGVSQPVPSVGTVLAAVRRQAEASDRPELPTEPASNGQHPKTYEEACLVLLRERQGAPMTLRDLVNGLRERNWMRGDLKLENAIEIIRGTMRTLVERQPGRVVRVQDSPVAYAMHPSEIAGSSRPATRFPQ